MREYNREEFLGWLAQRAADQVLRVGDFYRHAPMSGTLASRVEVMDQYMEEFQAARNSDKVAMATVLEFLGSVDPE
jgi:hypothetical protein